MKGLKVDWKQSSMLALVVTLAALGVQWVFSNVIGQAIRPLFSSIPVTTPLTGTVGAKVLSFVGGILPIGSLDFMGYLTLFISSLALLVIGELIIDNFKLPTIKGIFGIDGRMGRLMSVILYGSIPVYLILVGFALPSIMTVVGVAIYTFIVSIVAVWVAGLLKLKI